MHTKKEPVFLLRILVIILISVTLYAVNDLRQSETSYNETSATLTQQPIVAKRVQVGSKTVAIPSYDMFEAGNVWALVSRERRLSGEAGHTLIDIPVAHGDADMKMQVAREISDALQQLVNAAEADGESLMVSSAYRSLAEQQAIFEEYVAEAGEAMAALYVLPVGASEHHTGLAVDFSSTSDACAADSDDCSLGVSSAEWLEANASRFGFILRYPDGKQSITGVGYEPWHYRYVGAPLARAIATSDMTLDEVIQQIAPGYAKTR